METPSETTGHQIIPLFPDTAGTSPPFSANIHNGHLLSCYFIVKNEQIVLKNLSYMALAFKRIKTGEV